MKQTNRFKVVGYGSLISHESLKETVRNKKFTPVIVKGYKRIFNLIDGKKDVLNIVKDKDSKFNGVLFSVDESELKKLIKRELEYSMEKVEVYNFKTNKKIGKAFTFIDYFLDIDDGKITPNKSYFLLCREAAYHISNDFGEMWDKTTFTSDGKQITEYENKINLKIRV